MVYLLIYSVQEPNNHESDKPDPSFVKRNVLSPNDASVLTKCARDMGFDLGSNNSQRLRTRSSYNKSGTRCPQAAGIGDVSFSTLICQATGRNPISQQTKDLMSQAVAMKVAGGIGALPKIDGEAYEILCKLDTQFREYVRGDYDLGFVQIMEMEGGTVVEPHHDGVNDGDLVLVVAAQGVAQCVVEGESFLMNPMDVYALRPGEQLHSVRALPGTPRYAFTLRYFSLGNSNLDVSNLHLWRAFKGDSHTDDGTNGRNASLGGPLSEDDNGLSKRPRLEVRFAHSALL
jgi:hypothetical protein